MVLLRLLQVLEFVLLVQPTSQELVALQALEDLANLAVVEQLLLYQVDLVALELHLCLVILEVLVDLPFRANQEEQVDLLYQISQVVVEDHQFLVILEV